MLKNSQHYFDDNYRLAHNTDAIASAEPRQMAIIVHELHNEFLQTINEVVEEDITVPECRFSLFGKLLEDCLNNENIREMQSFHLQMAICTGSLMEAVLQMFLIAYQHEYVESHWKQWINTDVDILYQSIGGYLGDLVCNKTINADQRKSILSVLKRDFSERKNIKNISIIMLDELIGFCRNQKIFHYSDHTVDPIVVTEGEEYKQMEKIRDCRNNIHAFTKKEIPVFNDALQNVRNYCIIVLDLISRVEGLILD